MHRTRLLAFAAVVTLALAPLAACSGDDGATASTTTAKDGGVEQNEGTSLGDTTESTATTAPTVPDAQFTTVMGDLTSKIDNAGTDPCALSALIASSNLPTPTGSAQAEQAGRLIAGLLNALAASNKPGNEANAQLLRDTATKIVQTGESSGWTLESIQQQLGDGNVAQAWASYAEGCPGLGSDAPQPPG